MKANCYNCLFGTWSEEDKMNTCYHENAGVAAACYSFNQECPYYAEALKEGKNGQ